MKKTKFITFSGGCFSGKTTTMKLAKEVLESRGAKVVMLDELMRDKKIVSIDDIRKNPVEYLNLQEEIITKKINMEHALHLKNEKCFVLADRAITDSLFYLLFYVDKSQLDYKDMLRYEKLYAFIDEYAHRAFTNIYDILIEFVPLSNKACVKTCDDKYRPMNLLVQRHSEYRLIRTLNAAYLDPLSDCQYISLDVAKTDKEQLKHLFNMLYEKFYYHGI